MKPPALPIVPGEYSQRHFDQTYRILTQYFTQSEQEKGYLANRSTPQEVTVNTQMGDANHTFFATVSGLTLTLPPAEKSRLGLDWTVVLATPGWVDIAVTSPDEFVLPSASATIRLNVEGASVSLRCLSASKWGIV